MAPSSNGEQGLAGTVLPSLPQSLRQGPHGRGLLLIHRSVTQLTKKARKIISGKEKSSPLPQAWLAPAATNSDTAALGQVEPLSFTKGNSIKKVLPGLFGSQKQFSGASLL